ncbi:MAG TPA: hypothetical protein VGK10_15525, partial [Prolixibacteraceae bacterium]
HLMEKLDELKAKGYSIIKPYGFDMFSNSFPEASLMEVKYGVADNRHLRKCIIFNPNMIEEINFKAGCHQCFPKGQVKYYSQEDFKLLHYKSLGLPYLIDRYEMFRKRLSAFNIENKLGKHYMAEKEHIRTNYLNKLSKSVNVFEPIPRSRIQSILGIFARKNG